MSISKITKEKIARHFKISGKKLTHYAGHLDGGHRFIDHKTGKIYGYNVFDKKYFQENATKKRSRSKSRRKTHKM